MPCCAALRVLPPGQRSAGVFPASLPPGVPPFAVQIFPPAFWRVLPAVHPLLPFQKSHGASSCSGSASGFSISSRSASGSGCASSPSRTSPVGISCGCSAAASSVSCFSLPRPNRPNRFCGFSSGWVSSLRVISSGISTAVVLKKERNFSSGVISRPLFLSFGILVPPVIQIEVPARMPDHACCAARWDWISYRIMPAATDTL